MAARRRTTPLFEVLRDQQADRAEPRPSSVPAETKATPSRQTEPAPLGTEPGTESPVRVVGGIVHIPLAYAGVGAALVLAAILGTWSLAYQRGRADQSAEQQLLFQTALGPESRVVEPDSQAGQVLAQSRAQMSGSGSDASPVGPRRFLTSSGETNTDPRMDRHNYLQLGSDIRASEVASAVELMVTRGLGCFGVRLDRTVRGANDEPLYVLFASRGFPSGESDSDAARRYQQQVLAAGVAWKRAGGVKNFDDATWALHRAR